MLERDNYAKAIQYSFLHSFLSYNVTMSTIPYYISPFFIFFFFLLLLIGPSICLVCGNVVLYLPFFFRNNK